MASAWHRQTDQEQVHHPFLREMTDSVHMIGCLKKSIHDDTQRLRERLCARSRDMQKAECSERAHWSW